MFHSLFHFTALIHWQIQSFLVHQFMYYPYLIIEFSTLILPPPPICLDLTFTLFLSSCAKHESQVPIHIIQFTSLQYLCIVSSTFLISF